MELLFRCYSRFYKILKPACKAGGLGVISLLYILSEIATV